MVLAHWRRRRVQDSRVRHDDWGNGEKSRKDSIDDGVNTSWVARMGCCWERGRVSPGLRTMPTSDH